MAKDIKPIVEIQQKGNDFVVTSKTPNKSVTNSFTLGKEAEITTMDGRKLKVKESKNGTSLYLSLNLNLYVSGICLYHFHLQTFLSLQQTEMFLKLLFKCCTLQFKLAAVIVKHQCHLFPLY